MKKLKEGKISNEIFWDFTNAYGTNMYKKMPRHFKSFMKAEWVSRNQLACPYRNRSSCMYITISITLYSIVLTDEHISVCTSL